MSDPRMAMGRGAPMARPPMPGGGGMRAQESILNPADLAMKAGRGEVRPDMTIREFFGTIGLDVDRNTMQDMAKALGQQAQMGNPLNKMRAMAGGAPQGMPRPGMAPGGPQGQAPDLESLLGRIK